MLTLLRRQMCPLSHGPLLAPLTILMLCQKSGILHMLQVMILHPRVDELTTLILPPIHYVDGTYGQCVGIWLCVQFELNFLFAYLC